LSSITSSSCKNFQDQLSLAGKNLSFFTPDNKEFPALDLLNTDQEISLNAANDVAVEKFLSGEIQFHDIVSLIKTVLDSYHYSPHKINSIDDVLSIYDEARIFALNKSKSLRKEYI
jgi:1-deoxy-D-xylulose 5-phosphate reductoisomerase